MSLFCSQLREMPVNSPERPWRVDPAQVAARRDLRESRLVFSIDPRGCEDVDDTLSVHRLDGGAALELGVHIADVTHFVAEGSLTDVEARLRLGASWGPPSQFRLPFEETMSVF